MTLSDYSIKNPVFAWMIMVGLIVFGFFCFRGIGISQLPDVDFPVVNVNVTLEGAAPEVMETQVTDIIEDAVMSVEGIKEVSSVSRQGQASITIEFELNRDIDVALQEVQTKIAQAQKNLPKEVDPPVVTKNNPEDQPIMWVAFSSPTLPLKDIMSYTNDVLKNKLTIVPGVGEIILGGYIDPNLRVWLDPKKMEENEITVTDIINAIQSGHQEIPAGYIDNDNQELSIRVMGEANTVDDFKKIIIPQRSGAPIWKNITIGDVASVEENLNDPRRISRHMGTPGVGLGIKKQRGTNAVAVAKAVKEQVALIQKTLPANMQLKVVFDTTKFIEESTHELNFTLVLSGILTGIVCWFFLGSWSSTFNVLLAIPTSIMGSFIFIYFFGFTLNTFTLLGLALAIGIVVDDAIMVLENIVRYLEKGFPRVKAAIVGSREITPAAVAATIAILAIFVPVVFMKGIIGKFLFQYGITMTVAVVLSLIEALTLAPMRSAQYLKTGHGSFISRKVDVLMEKLKNGYKKGLSWSLNNRAVVLIIAFSLFGASIFLSGSITKEFVPSQDQGRVLVRVQTPLGSSLSFTSDVMKKAEEIVSKMPSVDQYYLAVGGFGGGEVNTAMMFITLKDKEKRLKQNGNYQTQAEIMGLIRGDFNKIPGVMRAIVQDLSLSGFSAQRGFPVEFSIRGPDLAKLGELGAEMMKKMKESGLMIDMDTDYQLGSPEIRVVPNRTAGASLGVSVSSIGQTINALIGGERVAKYTKNGKRYDVRVRLLGEDRKAPEDITKVWVRNIHGELVKLSEVVTFEEKPSLLTISRKNRERSVNVYSNIAPNKSQNEALAEVEKIAKEVIPDGYRIVISGSAATFQESSQSLMMALLMGIFVAYMVLASQFNSFIHPFTILLALPFSLTGALVALKLGGQSLNIFSMIGIILLMGIVKKNSILLVDFTNQKRKSNLEKIEEPLPNENGPPALPNHLKKSSVTEALLYACPTRLRPILMTSVATIAAAIPPALGFGPGAETRIPMALVVIGGVLTSTFLTLFVVPCAYSLFSKIENHTHDQNLKEALIELGEK